MGWLDNIRTLKAKIRTKSEIRRRKSAGQRTSDRPLCWRTFSQFDLRPSFGFRMSIFSLLMLSGCTTAHYRRSADSDVYGIVHQIEGQIFSHTNSFTIDTPYSNRQPKKISFAELVEDRLQTNQRVLT